MIFANPPLIELIAELRWLPWPDMQIPAPGTIMQVPFAPAHVEQTMGRFVDLVAAYGFSMSERVLPPNFPLVPFGVVYRIRETNAEQKNFLYQIGPGVFSANALLPYRNWNNFKPIVERGIRALIDSRHELERGKFTAVSLRYINLFSDVFTEGQSGFTFLTEVLGMKVEMPAGVVQQVSDWKAAKLGIQLSVPLKTGLNMNLALNEGTGAGKNGIVMMTEVIAVQPTTADVGIIMDVLENAHTSIRTTFVALTNKLNAKMQPVI
ncbi:MAG: TIGR04255 family protein [Candidatus Sulfotelmatobacter sp.]|jgi:uncharacterized protein (TIGR04255 family)